MSMEDVVPTDLAGTGPEEAVTTVQENAFVLFPERKGAIGRASQGALLMYAQYILKSNPTQAQELLDWVSRVITPEEKS